MVVAVAQVEFACLVIAVFVANPVARPALITAIGAQVAIIALRAIIAILAIISRNAASASVAHWPTTEIIFNLIARLVSVPDTIVVLIPSLVADSFFTILQRLTPRFARLKKLGARRWRYGSAASAAIARTRLIHEIFDIVARRIASNHEGRIGKYIVAALHAAVRYGVACASFPVAVAVVREALGASRVKSFKIRR
jgi:hypothetical protein